MNRRQAKKIARLYIGKIAQQDDAFFVPGLSHEDQQMIADEIQAIGGWLLGNDADVDSEQHLIVGYVLNRSVMGQDSYWDELGKTTPKSPTTETI